MKPIIEVKGLWKEYQRGAQKERYLSLRDQVFNIFKPTPKKDSFYALEDINFDVYPGDSLAIIGKNGAGKSTLLKILSKITPPTKGEIILSGRLASLLEVGTGFHAELTGRENIYLNGSILGLKRHEINAQFDEIVEFSGVEDFLDTPLKHYSSGMQLRLAFAVAAHLEPEILVIDEVLAVGDSAFQQKCINKMTEVSQSGRTIIFVSHNMQAVRNLCCKAILLNRGRLELQAEVEKVIDQYVYNSATVESNEVCLIHHQRDTRSVGYVLFEKIHLAKKIINFGESIKINIFIKAIEDVKNYVVGINLSNMYDETIYHISNQWIDEPKNIKMGNYQLHFIIENNLRPGQYKISLFSNSDGGIQDWLKDVLTFEIEEGNPYNYSNSQIIQGKVFPTFSFNFEKYFRNND